MVGMGDELKVYIPRMVQPVLLLFLQDESDMKIATQKVGIKCVKYPLPHLLPSLPLQMLCALQLCGASLDDYLHLLVPPVVKVFETESNPTEVRRLERHVLPSLSPLPSSLTLQYYMYVTGSALLLGLL